MVSKPPDKIAESLEGLEKPVVLTLIDPIRYQDAVVDLLRYFIGRTSHGVYVSLNKPYAVLTKAFDKAGIASSSLFFVDGITNVPAVEEDSCHAAWVLALI